jgi:hypothetical protein
VQPAAGTDCGAAFVNAQSGGAHGYAAVYIAPNLGGCGTAGAGGFFAVVAAHELINELGALPPGTPGPPHRCPGDPLHPCDNTLDVLAPTPTATTLATAILDFGRDDYYAHAGTWWDVQDSSWLRHLDAREYRMRVTVGTGGRFVVDTSQPSMVCEQPSTCTWTWQAGSQLALSAEAAPGYRFLRWIGCPSAQTGVCTLTIEGGVRIAAVFAQPLNVTGFHLAFSRDRSALTATLRLSAAGRADSVGCSFARRPVLASSVRGRVATCTWSVPARFRGHRLTGVIDHRGKGEALASRRFHVRVPKG